MVLAPPPKLPLGGCMVEAEPAEPAERCRISTMPPGLAHRPPVRATIRLVAITGGRRRREPPGLAWGCMSWGFMVVVLSLD